MFSILSDFDWFRGPRGGPKSGPVWGPKSGPFGVQKVIRLGSKKWYRLETKKCRVWDQRLSRLKLRGQQIEIRWLMTLCTVSGCIRSVDLTSGGDLALPETSKNDPQIVKLSGSKIGPQKSVPQICQKSGSKISKNQTPKSPKIGPQNFQKSTPKISKNRPPNQSKIENPKSSKMRQFGRSPTGIG